MTTKDKKVVKKLRRKRHLLLPDFFTKFASLLISAYYFIMHIHFVCSGNTNRSRMAEAYLKSKKLPGISASSSGINADKDRNGSLSKYAEYILAEEGIGQFASRHWVQTTKAIVAKADVVVFMKKIHCNYVLKKLGYTPPRYEVWNIEDVASDFWHWLIPLRKKKIIKDTKIFYEITDHVDALLKKLKKV